MFKRCFICISLILNVNLKSKTALTDPAETFFFSPITQPTTSGQMTMTNQKTHLFNYVFFGCEMKLVDYLSFSRAPEG